MQMIAVTGANGFVGQHVLRELIDNGYKVLAIGGGTGSPKPLSDDRITYVPLDLLRPEQVATLDLSAIDAIIHLAGLAAVGPSFDDPELYLTSNPAMQSNLFEAAKAQAVYPRFLIVSSGSLYDPRSPLPITEESPVLPSSPYAESKLRQEAQQPTYLDAGFEVIVARPFNHTGPGQNLGFIVPDLTSQVVACERSKTAQILVGNLDAKRDYTDVRDIARAYRLLLERGQSGQTYNICSGQSRSGQEVLDTILKHSAAQITVTQDPSRMRPSDTPDIYGSHDKLTTDTGWQPQINFDQTIQDVLNDWRQQPA